MHVAAGLQAVSGSPVGMVSRSVVIGWRLNWACSGLWLGHGGSCLVCQVLRAIGALSILELAANSGSSRMFQAPNLHLVTQLLNEVKCSLTELTTRSNCSQLLSVVLIIFAHALDSSCFAWYSLFNGMAGRRSILCGGYSRFPSPLYFPLFISVTGACLLEGVGVHGWFVRLFKALVQSPSWNWLPIMEAPGWIRHPTST